MMMEKLRLKVKPVTKVMVEGKDFFDGDSKIASKNILFQCG